MNSQIRKSEKPKANYNSFVGKSIAFEAVPEGQLKLLRTDPINLSRYVPAFNEKMLKTKISFNKFLTTLLEQHEVEEFVIKKILSNSSYMQGLERSLTDPSVDSINNLELFEIVGDSAFHHAITNMIYSRFPQLGKMPNPEAIVSILRANMEKGGTYSYISYKLGFTPYIKCDKLTLEANFDQILEDLFESFYGCLEHIIDEIYGDGQPHGFNFISHAANEFFEALYQKEFDEISEILDTGNYKEVVLRLSSRVGVLKEIMNGNSEVVKYDQHSVFDRYFEFLEPIEKIEGGRPVYYCVCRVKLEFYNRESPRFEPSVALGKKEAKEMASDVAIRYLESIGIGYKHTRAYGTKKRKERHDNRCHPHRVDRSF